MPPIESTSAGDGAPPPRALLIAIVTGGSSAAGRKLARGLAGRRWAVALAYLEDQRTVEAAVAAAGGTIVAVRADLADELDVQRLFAESRAALGIVDVVAHTTTEDPSFLFAYAARNVRSGGLIVALPGAGPMTPVVARPLHERGIAFETASAEELPGFLDRWQRRH